MIVDQQIIRNCISHLLNTAIIKCSNTIEHILLKAEVIIITTHPNYFTTFHSTPLFLRSFMSVVSAHRVIASLHIPPAPRWPLEIEHCYQPEPLIPGHPVVQSSLAHN